MIFTYSKLYYKNELEKLENEVFKNYCYCILLGQSFDVFYKTKGKMRLQVLVNLI